MSPREHGVGEREGERMREGERKRGEGVKEGERKRRERIRLVVSRCLEVFNES